MIMEKSYFICSESVIKEFPDVTRSGYFKTGYKDWEDLCIALLDFEEVNKRYIELNEPENYWCQELICGGTMDESKITINSIKKNGLLADIENKLNLTTAKNIALIFVNLSERYHLGYIQLGDKLAYKKKLKTYVLTISRNYPKTHPRKGQETYFVEKILSEQIPCGLIPKDDVEKFNPFSMTVFYSCAPKLHTIRVNYELWAKRIKEVQEGKAVLSIRYWSGKPYNSKQIEIRKLDKDSGIGVQKLRWLTLSTVEIIDNGVLLNDTQICKNDGLSLDDFESWFKGYDLSEPMAIIHFTKFRY